MSTGIPCRTRQWRSSLSETHESRSWRVREAGKSQSEEIFGRTEGFSERVHRQVSRDGLFEDFPQASCQAAAHLVPKDSKSKFSNTVNLRPVIAAAREEQWPVAVTEAELGNSIGSTYCAYLEFCTGYWQCPLDPSSYVACGIIALQGLLFQHAY